MKKYWLRGLIVGIIFGALVTIFHENALEWGRDFFGIDYDSSLNDLNIVQHGFVLLTQIDQFLYTIHVILLSSLLMNIMRISEFVGDVLGIIFLVSQYFLPSVVYGLFGMIMGLVYEKVKKA